MASDGPLYTHDLLAIVATDIFVEMMARPPAEKKSDRHPGQAQRLTSSDHDLSLL
jgi:hypothetical protein